jgi:hypothetical protein
VVDQLRFNLEGEHNPEAIFVYGGIDGASMCAFVDGNRGARGCVRNIRLCRLEQPGRPF